MNLKHDAFQWDNLIVLDACRYDTFKRWNTLPGTLKKGWSPASCTLEWRHKFWWGASYPNVIYVSGNVRVRQAHFQGVFKRVVEVWRAGDPYRPKEVAVEPLLVNAAVLALEQKTGLVIHYLQPHAPYPGSSVLWRNPRRAHRLLVQGRLYQAKYQRAYERNLLRVLLSVYELLPGLEGRTVIISDHGEDIEGKTKRAHPCYSDLPFLHEVPFFVVNTKGVKRRDDEEVVRSRLKGLGYV